MSRFLLKKIILNENERVVKIIRSQPIAFFWSILFSAILIIAPFFFLYLLIQKEKMGIIIFICLLAIGIISLFRIWILWYFNSWIVTNFKIIDIDQRKLFDRRISEIPFEIIKDISYRTRGVIATFFKLGEIEILVSDDKLSFILRKVAWPQAVLQLINDLKLKKIEREIEGKNLSAQELVKLVEKIRRGLGEDKFRELVSSSENTNGHEYLHKAARTK